MVFGSLHKQLRTHLSKLRDITMNKVPEVPEAKASRRAHLFPRQDRQKPGSHSLFQCGNAQESSQSFRESALTRWPSGKEVNRLQGSLGAGGCLAERRGRRQPALTILQPPWGAEMLDSLGEAPRPTHSPAGALLLHGQPTTPLAKAHGS